MILDKSNKNNKDNYYKLKSELNYGNGYNNNEFNRNKSVYTILCTHLAALAAIVYSYRKHGSFNIYIYLLISVGISCLFCLTALFLLRKVSVIDKDRVNKKMRAYMRDLVREMLKRQRLSLWQEFYKSVQAGEEMEVVKERVANMYMSLQPINDIGGDYSHPITVTGKHFYDYMPDIKKYVDRIGREEINRQLVEIGKEELTVLLEEAIPEVIEVTPEFIKSAYNEEDEKKIGEMAEEFREKHTKVYRYWINIEFEQGDLLKGPLATKAEILMQKYRYERFTDLDGDKGFARLKKEVEKELERQKIEESREQAQKKAHELQKEYNPYDIDYILKEPVKEPYHEKPCKKSYNKDYKKERDIKYAYLDIWCQEKKDEKTGETREEVTGIQDVRLFLITERDLAEYEDWLVSQRSRERHTGLIRLLHYF